MDTETEGFRLRAGDLASKWGFDDGGFPAEVAERLQADAWDDAWYRRAVDVWQDVLTGLVRDKLIPALGVEVVLTDWGGGGSMHNPCEATSIDGVPLQDEDGRRISGERFWVDRLRPAYVVVPWGDVGERLASAMADPAVGKSVAR